MAATKRVGVVNTLPNNCVNVEYFASLREHRLPFFRPGRDETARRVCSVNWQNSLQWRWVEHVARTRELIPSIVQLTSSCALCGRSSLKWTRDRSRSFRIEIPTAYVVFVCPTGWFPHFLANMGNERTYVYSYEKISLKYSRAICRAVFFLSRHYLSLDHF